MFVRLSALLPIAAFTFASAVSAGVLNARGGSECSTGTVACCDEVLESNNPAIIAEAALLGVILPIEAVLAGLTCDVVDVTTCSEQAVCCQNVYGSGLLVLDCDAISL